jgi:hypothetical protein
MQENKNKSGKILFKSINGDVVPIAQKGKERRTENLSMRVSPQFKAKHQKFFVRLSDLLHKSMDGIATKKQFNEILKYLKDEKDNI